MQKKRKYDKGDIVVYFDTSAGGFSIGSLAVYVGESEEGNPLLLDCFLHREKTSEEVVTPNVVEYDKAEVYYLGSNSVKILEEYGL